MDTRHQTSFLGEKETGQSKTMGASHDFSALMGDFGILTSCYYLHSPWFFGHQCLVRSPEACYTHLSLESSAAEDPLQGEYGKDTAFSGTQLHVEQR